MSPAWKGFFREFRPEVVSHHAAQANVRASWYRLLEDAQANILGSLALLREAVRWQVKKVIYSSCGAIYGEPTILPVAEDYIPHPLSNYGVSTYATKLYLQSFQAASGLKCITFRYPNVYGPRQDPAGEAGVVAIWAMQLLQGKHPRVFGDGRKTRDYVYVDDIVTANLLALGWDDCSTLNLGWGGEITDLEVFHAVRAAVGSSLEPVFDERRPGEIDHICLNSDRAKKLLGWQPKVSFQDGVARVVSYWSERLAQVRIIPA